jgi:hypothetical protein
MTYKDIFDRADIREVIKCEEALTRGCTDGPESLE